MAVPHWERGIRGPKEMNHRDTEKRNAEKRRGKTAKEARKPGKDTIDSSSFLVSWLP
jgi:hypothetical protein